MLDEPLSALRDRLLDRLAGLDSCAVAFSGGVDSAVAAKAARLALGDHAAAVTGVSPSLASGELEIARRVARQIGIRHVELPTGEMDREAYTRNAGDRCFHCKDELYSRIEEVLARLNVAVMINGANADDLGDYRPGLEAARQHGVRSPLAELGISKLQVRQLAAEWELEVWDKPASPCLSSRVAYGQEVTAERLERIDRAEQLLRSLGVSPVRVRLHAEEHARIEAPLEALTALSSEPNRSRICAELRRLGFRFITLDLEGFRSGSLNDLLQIGRQGGQ